MTVNVFTLYTQRVGGPDTHTHTHTHTHTFHYPTESISCEEKGKIAGKSGIHRRRESKAEG